MIDLELDHGLFALGMFTFCWWILSTDERSGHLPLGDLAHAVDERQCSIGLGLNYRFCMFQLISEAESHITDTKGIGQLNDRYLLLETFLDLIGGHEVYLAEVVEMYAPFRVMVPFTEWIMTAGMIVLMFLAVGMDDGRCG